MLANVVRKPLEEVFIGFSGGSAGHTDDFYSGSGKLQFFKNLHSYR